MYPNNFCKKKSIWKFTSSFIKFSESFLDRLVSLWSSFLLFKSNPGITNFPSSSFLIASIEEVFFNVEGDLVQPIDSFIRIYPTGVDNQMLTHIHANAYVSGVDPYIKISGVADVMPIESEFKFGPTWIIDSSGIKYEF